MAGALWFRDAKKQGYEEGVQTGIAQQKAEDEKRIAQKDAEIQRLIKENEKLKSKL